MRVGSPVEPEVKSSASSASMGSANRRTSPSSGASSAVGSNPAPALKTKSVPAPFNFSCV